MSDNPRRIVAELCVAKCLCFREAAKAAPRSRPQLSPKRSTIVRRRNARKAPRRWFRPVRVGVRDQWWADLRFLYAGPKSASLFAQWTDVRDSNYTQRQHAAWEVQSRGSEIPPILCLRAMDSPLLRDPARDSCMHPKLGGFELRPGRENSPAGDGSQSDSLSLPGDLFPR